MIGGGATRMESALAGVSAVRRGAELIAIHDGARPLISQEVITRTILAARQYRAAVPAVPSTDTLKAVDEKLRAGEGSAIELARKKKEIQRIVIHV